ncbi:endonuclease/exonuclease/phosphatase family protein [Vibrio ostreicida]|uniref:endonuclease/exonuclease/phosphatase family protein n=1 Tax=Vibrio ostreicida TaxID=526588 RepID=UPI003B5AB3BD
MLTDKTLTLATANLFNFIKPPNAFYDFENIYDNAAWQQKCRWTQHNLQILNADIIGVQEVFSIDAAQQLFADMGYPYFTCVDTPHVESGYIYSQPVVALASRYPITHTQAVTTCALPLEKTNLDIPEFSRAPIYAVIDVPDIGQVAVYVCHLKSQRASANDAPEQAQALIGRWLSSQQRGWEAVLLRLFIEQQYQTQPVPTALLGDMNQPLTLGITGLLTSALSPESVRLNLEDSWSLYHNNQPAAERPATHYHFATGNVLDYILLSQEFHPDSQHCLADITQYQTLDNHLINPNFEQDKQASDHAFVAVTARFVL